MQSTRRPRAEARPVSVDEAGVDVVGALHPSDWLQTDARGLVGHDVDQPVLELIAGQVGAHEARGVGFGTGQALEGEGGAEGQGEEPAGREEGCTREALHLTTSPSSF